MSDKKYVFRWKEGAIVVPLTWDYQEFDVWRHAIKFCRFVYPQADDAAAETFVRQYGEVVELEAT